MKYPVIFKPFPCFSHCSQMNDGSSPSLGERSSYLLRFLRGGCTEKKDKWRYHRMMLLSLIYGVGELL